MTDEITARRFRVKIDSFDLSLAATDAHDPQSFIDGAKYWAEKHQQDAQDAARYRWLRDAHWSEIEALYWHPDVQGASSPEAAQIALDGLIDREIAAMKESTP